MAVEKVGKTSESKLSEKFMSPKICDFKIICEGQEFPCHQDVLRHGSQYFEAMFSHGFQESTTGQMVIKDALAEDLKTIICFLYTEKVPEKSVRKSLLSLADRFGLENLLKTIVENRIKWSRMKSYNGILEAIEVTRAFGENQRLTYLLKITVAIEDLEIRNKDKLWQKLSQLPEGDYINFCRKTKPFFRMASRMFEQMSKIDSKQSEEIKKVLIKHKLGLPNTPEVQELVFNGNHDGKLSFIKLSFITLEDKIIYMATSEDVRNYLKCIKKEEIPEECQTKALFDIALFSSECFGSRLFKHFENSQQFDEIAKVFLEDGFNLPNTEIFQKMTRKLAKEVALNEVEIKHQGSITTQDIEILIQYLKYRKIDRVTNGVLLLAWFLGSPDMIEECLLQFKKEFDESYGWKANIYDGLFMLASLWKSDDEQQDENTFPEFFGGMLALFEIFPKQRTFHLVYDENYEGSLRVKNWI